MVIQKLENKKDSGQGMTEYLIIVALIAISAIAVVRATSKNLQVGFGKVGRALQGTGSDGLDYSTIDGTQVQDRDMGSFSNEAAGD